MIKKIAYIVGVIVIILAFYYFFSLETRENNRSLSVDYKATVYTIAGKPVVIGGDGVKYFGNEVNADFNKDGRVDIAFLLSQKVAKGTMYYIVAGINTPRGYIGSQAAFVGADISPQTTLIRTNEKGLPLVVVNYAQGSAPSVGKSLVLKFDAKDLSFGEVVQNFEGETNTAKMSLSMKSWEWQTSADKQGKFVLTFMADGKFSSKTDCNTVGGSYTALGNKLSFGPMFSTLMFCEDSIEQKYSTLLGNTVSFEFTGKSELVLTLKTGETMIFK